MDACEFCEVKWSEVRTLAALTLTVTLVFAAYFIVRAEVPDLPLHVHQALSAIPSWPGGS